MAFSLKIIQWITLLITLEVTLFLIFLLNLIIAEGNSVDLIVKHKQYSMYRINIYRFYLSHIEEGLIFTCNIYLHILHGFISTFLTFEGNNPTQRRGARMKCWTSVVYHLTSWLVLMPLWSSRLGKKHLYAHVCERKASECADRSVEIAGNESLDYCISAEHWQIIEAKWDWQDPSKLKERLIEESSHSGQPTWFIISPSQSQWYRFDEVAVDGLSVMRRYIFSF